MVFTTDGFFEVALEHWPRVFTTNGLIEVAIES